jgi:CRISPR/Cas system-associated protein Cas7 (RAMP superfamily)
MSDKKRIHFNVRIPFTVELSAKSEEEALKLIEESFGGIDEFIQYLCEKEGIELPEGLEIHESAIQIHKVVEIKDNVH